MYGFCPWVWSGRGQSLQVRVVEFRHDTTRPTLLFSYFSQGIYCSIYFILFYMCGHPNQGSGPSSTFGRKVFSSSSNSHGSHGNEGGYSASFGDGLAISYPNQSRLSTQEAYKQNGRPTYQQMLQNVNVNQPLLPECRWLSLSNRLNHWQQFLKYFYVHSHIMNTFHHFSSIKFR